MMARPVRLKGARSKFNVRLDPVGQAARTVDGMKFASQAEAKRYGELRLLEKAGDIARLVMQPAFPLHVVDGLGIRVEIGVYYGDFQYFDVIVQQTVVEDVKGMPGGTALYRWKKRHMLAEYGIQIHEVRR